jgi:hypothetical protein
MYKYERCLLAYLLIDRLNEATEGGYGIRSRIHVLCALKPESIDEDLTLNSQQNIPIDHAARAAKSSYGIDKIQDLQIFVEDGCLRLSYQLLRGKQIIQRNGIQLCDIPTKLDSNEVLINRGFNTSPQEREHFRHLLLQLGNKVNEDIHPKIQAFHQLLSVIVENQDLVDRIVNFENSEVGDRFLQTILGAGIFYLPMNAENHWNGKISVEALCNLVNDGIRPTKDHILPRRLGASHLLQAYRDNQMTPALLQNYYNENLAQYTLLTSGENTILINYFLNYDNYDEALLANGIILFPQNGRFANNQEFNDFIAFLSQNSPINVGDIFARWKDFQRHKLDV